MCKVNKQADRFGDVLKFEELFLDLQIEEYLTNYHFEREHQHFGVLIKLSHILKIEVLLPLGENFAQELEDLFDLDEILEVML